jgi:hypothetical protein
MPGIIQAFGLRPPRGMGSMSDSFAKPENHSHSRQHAETAISIALVVCEAGEATEMQLADLADAVEAFRDKQYRVSTILAEAAIERRRPDLSTMRPRTMSRSIVEIRALFASIQCLDHR